MIISASRRTDIPAFYGDWFLQRLKEGLVDRVNPMNSKQVTRLLFTPDSIEGIIFWTKNPIPFLKFLEETPLSYYRKQFLYTLNSYPAEVEPGMASVEERVDAFRYLSGVLGKNSVVWRYDPVLLDKEFTLSWHLKKLEFLKSYLEGFTTRLILSFVDFYPSVQKKFESNSSFQGKEINPPVGLKSRFLKEVHSLFEGGSISLSLCSQKEDFSETGIINSPCIDGNRLSELFGRPIKHKKDKGQRGECLCTQSFDIGAYDTCKYNCLYCYAKKGEGSPKRDYLQNPSSTSLIPYPQNARITIRDIRT